MWAVVKSLENKVQCKLHINLRLNLYTKKKKKYEQEKKNPSINHL